MDPNLEFSTTITMPGWAVYEVEDWHIARRDPQSITFRPSRKTLFKRLAITFVAAIVVGVLVVVRDDLAGLGALPEKGDAVEAVINAGIWLLVGSAGLVGLLSPLSTLWQKVTISRNLRGAIQLKALRMLAAGHEWPLEKLRSVGVVVEEQVIRPARGPQQHRGYVWRVGLVDQQGHWCAEFQIDRTKHAPLEGNLSERTRQCVEALQVITGLPYSGSPVFIEDGLGPRVMNASPEIMPGATSFAQRRGNVTQHVTTSSESHTYHSLDEMPPDIRARVEGMMAQQRGSGAQTFVSEQITISDENGTRTYHSVDEMPPEVRARYEEARRKFTK